MWDLTSGILGSSYLQVVAMDGHLLKSESLSGIFCRLEIHKCIVPISAYPHTNHDIILEYPDILPKLLQSAIKQLHELSIIQSLWNVSNVQLPFSLVMIRHGLIRVELLVVLKDLLSGHFGLLFFRRFV